MIAIIDYGMGNLRSVQKAFEFIGAQAVLTQDVQTMRDASHIVLPGVGAAADAIAHLRERELFEVCKAQANSGKPFLGICLGMQLLFGKSYENGEHECLALIEGEVVPFEQTGLRIPHMGWNEISIRANPLLTSDGEEVYFVHSYHAAHVPEQYVIATTEYGYAYPSAVQKENLFGLQFHPEKSGNVGLAMLKNFTKLR